MPSVQELIARRRLIAEQIRGLQEEQRHLDDAIFGTFESVATMFSSSQGGDWPVSLVPPASPVHLGMHRRDVGRADEVELPTGDRRRLMPAIVHVLGNTKGPVKTRELLEHLMQLGVDVGGKNPTNNLAAHLSSMSMVESTPEGWILRGQGR